MADKYTPRLKQQYEDRIVKAMTEKFGYKNRLEVPRLEKITLNMGVGEASQDKKKVQTAAEEMELIAGQKPVITKAKKSIAQFKLREGMPIGSSFLFTSTAALVSKRITLPSGRRTSLRVRTITAR